MTTMAYDFDTEVHVIELDEFGAATTNDAIVLGMLPAGRDETLTDAGFRIVGSWTVHGDADGVEVRR